MNIEIRVGLTPLLKIDGVGSEEALNFFRQSEIIQEQFGLLEIADEARFSEWLLQKLQTNENIIETLSLLNYGTFHDEYKSFGEVLSHTSALKTLDITSYSGNHTHLYEGIANNTSITELRATLDREAKSNSIYEDWKQLSKALARNKSIKKLTLNEVSYEGVHIPIVFDENAAVGFFNFLTHNEVMTELNTHCIRSTQDMMSMAEGLKHNRSVTKIVINGPPHTFGRSRDPRLHDIATLGNGIKHNTTLKEIQLDSVNLSTELLKGFFDALLVNTSVTSLVLKTLTIEGSADPLFQFLKTTQTIHKFELVNVSMITPNSSHEDLLLALAANTSIANLTLTRTTISQALSNLLCQNKTLKSLWLSGRSSLESVQAIEQALMVNDTLTRFEIYIFNDFPLSFANVLKQNTTLRSLSTYSMTSEDLIEIISTNSNLRELNLHARLDEELQKTVKKALENNFALLRVNLFDVQNSNVFSRNYELQKQRYEDTALVLHIIARSDLFHRLPREIWLSIFSYVRYPGLESFEPLAKSIFNRKQ